MAKSIHDVLAELHPILADLDPYALEDFVRGLPEEMTYDNAEVTHRPGDGGVDVVANIDIGIHVDPGGRAGQAPQAYDPVLGLGRAPGLSSPVRRCVENHHRDCSLLQGDTVGRLRAGVPPITLIDGEKLIDLLITHGISVRKKTLKVLELNAEEFGEVDESSTDSGCDAA